MSETRYRCNQYIYNILLSGLSPAACCSFSFAAQTDASLNGGDSSGFNGFDTSGDFLILSVPVDKMLRLGEPGSRLSTSGAPRGAVESTGVARDGVAAGVREEVSDCARILVAGSL